LADEPQQEGSEGEGQALEGGGGVGGAALDCISKAGQHAKVDPRGGCRCDINHEMVQGQCTPTEALRRRRALLESKPWVSLGPDDLPTCVSSAECAMALKRHLEPDLEALGGCMSSLAEAKAGLDAMAREMGASAGERGLEDVSNVDQARGLQVQNTRLLSELETLSSMGVETDKVQRTMRLMVTDNESIRRRIAEASKLVQRRHDQIAALEKDAVTAEERCDEYQERLREAYAEAGIRLPRFDASQ